MHSIGIGKTLLVMRLTTALILFACLQVSATGYSQTITISERNASVEKVIALIKQQTGYTFFYDYDLIQQGKRVTVDLKNKSLKEALDECFKEQPFSYTIIEKTITLKPKTILRPNNIPLVEPPPIDVKGKVTDESGSPVAGATIRIKGTSRITTTNDKGEFVFNGVADNAVLEVISVNIETKEVHIDGRASIAISVVSKVSSLQDVGVSVSTGYYTIPKDRATGSFEVIGPELMDRRVSTGILNRLDGMVSGVIFNKNRLAPNEKTGISIRGRSSIDLNVNADPLIILDNFPFEGNIDNINPNDIETITVLKDAAAASIWGARAGNGVIVITSKKGRYNQKFKIQFNSNLTIGGKPDVFYSPNYLPSSEFIGIEQFLFERGFYDNSISNAVNFTGLTPAVEIMAKRRSGQLSPAMAEQMLADLKGMDVRNDIMKYIYRPSINQQYSLNISGGGENNHYKIGLGFDHNDQNKHRNSGDRITLNAFNTFRPTQRLELTSGISYINSSAALNNPYALGNILTNMTNAGGGPYPYADITGVVVNSLRGSYKDSVEKLGFLDWQFRPLDELRLADNTTTTNHLILSGIAKYEIIKGWNLQAHFQQEQQWSVEKNLQSIESYQVRSTVNTYTQRTTLGVMSFPVPKGDILDLRNRSLSSTNYRFQSNFEKRTGDHLIVALAGAEVREVKSSSNSRRYYGYDPGTGTSVALINFDSSYRTNPSSSSRISPGSSTGISETVNRYVSAYINARYSYKDKYTMSVSGRKDGANIFGVNINQQITPLWSSGLAWDIGKEAFYRFTWLPTMRLRISYGYNGNVYNASAYLTANYSTSSLNGNRAATITSPANNNLRWERIENFNLGIDFATPRSKISGSIEFFQKRGKDLIEDAPLAPQTGFVSFKGNAAATKINGMDVTVNVSNIETKHFNWNSRYIFSYSSDKVVSADYSFVASNLANFNPSLASAGFYGILPVPGKSLYGIYSYKWAGLDASTGDPLGYLDGKISNNYNAIISNTPVDSLQYHGSARPRFYGAFLNTFTYKRLSVSLNITYKLGYFFRRASTGLNYNDALSNPTLNADYIQRWQKPGDEQYTSVPSLVYPSNTNRSLFYQNSEALVEKGDHFRLQDISIRYSFNRFQLYAYINNLGIIWKKARTSLDPDYITAYSLPDPRSFSLGITATF